MASSENRPILSGQTLPKKRVESIDAFRGFTILAMIFVIQAAGYKNLPLTFPQFGSAPVSTWKHAGDDGEPEEWAFWEKITEPTLYRMGEVTGGERGAYNVAWLDENVTTHSQGNVSITAAKPLRAGEQVIVVKHGPNPEDHTFQGVGNGCTFTDLVAPFFVFIVGVCIPLSKASRGPDWWKHALKRTFMLILAGVIYISLIFKLSYFWGILQAIGIAYFMGALMVQFPGWVRWIAIAVIATFHGWATWHIPWWVEFPWIDKSKPFWTIANLHQPYPPPGDIWKPLAVHCTPWGSISYGLCTIMGTLVGDALKTRGHHKILRTSLIVGLVFTAVGFILSKIGYPINKDYVSPSYTLFTGGIGALSFLIFYWVIDVWGFRKWAWFLNVFGANALLAYFMQVVVRLFSTALGTQAWFGHHAGWDGMLWAMVWTVVLWCVVWVCNKRGIYWKL